MANWIHCNAKVCEDSIFSEHWCCSECGKDITENPRFINKRTGEILDFYFCPYCGVKMLRPSDGKRVMVTEYNENL